MTSGSVATDGRGRFACDFFFDPDLGGVASCTGDRLRLREDWLAEPSSREEEGVIGGGGGKAG